MPNLMVWVFEVGGGKPKNCKGKRKPNFELGTNLGPILNLADSNGEIPPVR
jgi:hypothetical protein